MPVEGRGPELGAVWKGGRGLTTDGSLRGSAGSVRKLQTVLLAKAKEEPDRRFHALVDKVWREDFLLEAWGMIRCNGGAAGVDGVTVADVEAHGVDRWIGELLRDLKARGIEAPRLLMADGNAAIWGAVRQVWPEAGEQRCWNHKMRNVLDRLPQREQSEAKDLLRAVVYAPRRAEAVKAREVFARRYRPWYPKAVDVLEDDWERMVAFYDFPEDHWKHLRTTNVVESPFAALRLRTTVAKRFKRVESATALIWKLLLVAEKRFRRLDAPHLLKDVFEGRKFEDGKPVSTQQRRHVRTGQLGGRLFGSEDRAADRTPKFHTSLQPIGLRHAPSHRESHRIARSYPVPAFLENPRTGIRSGSLVILHREHGFLR